MLIKKEPMLCLCCQAPVKGRTDKKFCNDYCRNEYNNNLKAGITNLMRNVNHSLARNRRILGSFLQPGDQPSTVHRDRLAEKGFLFKYFTHTYTNKKNDVYFFCYDMGYLMLENDRMLIVKREEEKDCRITI